jgi:predicted RNA-binding Zn-ribbon protein involved in translation (DUF1610 family)
MIDMNSGISNGTNTCPSCGKTFIARYEKNPDTDIKHPIGCPHCDCTIGYASGTDDVSTFKK